ncbi:hypothetical protein CBS101457_006741 [Exobasidium rhododendri]|nr:hypothetical protein CBS101457_006741 [Exobasidium rhododendri]
MDFEDRPQPPPLLAFTASKQKPKLDRFGRKEKVVRRVKAGVSKTYNRNAAPPSRPRFTKPEAAVVFDDSSRREYLTGFHKRKQAKITKGKEKAKERLKQEHKSMRTELRESRKKMAAENVDAEKKAYGDEGELEEESDESDDGEENNDDRAASIPSAFETDQHHTTVTIQELNMDGSEVKPKKAPVRKAKVVKESLPPSSRRIAKRLKNGQGFEEVKSISKLMDNEEVIMPSLEEGMAPLDDVGGSEDQPAQEKGSNNKGYSAYGKTKKVRKPTFRYESKLERAKNKSEARASKAKWAEKRKEERIGSGGKNRLQKNKGKRGHGGKGSKKK